MKTLPCTCGSEDYATNCIEVNGEIIFDVTCHKCGKSVFARRHDRNEAMMSAIEQWNGDREPMTHDQRIIAYLAGKLAEIASVSTDKQVTPAEIIELAERNVHK